MRLVLSIAALATVSTLAFAQPQSPSPASGNLSKADRDFVDKAARAGLAEVAEGQLALKQASSRNVKDFARRMVHDHSEAGDQLKQIALGEGISPPASVSRSDAAQQSKLSRENGAAFDRDYIAAQRTAHKEAVALFAKESKSGTNPALKSFAAQTLPTLEEHYRMVTSISSRRRVSRSM